MMLRWEVGHEGQATILCITCPTWWKCTHYPGHSSVKQVKLIELCVQDNEGSLSSCVQDLNYIITGIFHIQYKPITYARGEIKFNKKVLGKGTLTWYHLFPTHFLLNYLYFTNGDVFNKCVLGVPDTWGYLVLETVTPSIHYMCPWNQSYSTHVITDVSSRKGEDEP